MIERSFILPNNLISPPIKNSDDYYEANWTAINKNLLEDTIQKYTKNGLQTDTQEDIEDKDMY